MGADGGGGGVELSRIGADAPVVVEGDHVAAAVHGRARPDLGRVGRALGVCGALCHGTAEAEEVGGAKRAYVFIVAVPIVALPYRYVHTYISVHARICEPPQSASLQPL